MKILSIETSCDDTGIAIIKAEKDKFSILSNIVSSQIKIHQKYGGVYPTMAKREHQKNLVPVLIKALKEAKLAKEEKSDNSKIKDLGIILEREKILYDKLKKFLVKYARPDIDIIAVTKGPGLEPCLWVGINFAKALSYCWNIPIVAVNHIESHILVNLLKNKVRFPAVSLVVSGGHTQIILMKKIGDYKILGETRDDAAGECFDKTAKILGLGYPGGPIISELAKKGGNELPRPMILTKDYDFSFSGLKTAVLYDYKKRDKKTQKSNKYIREMCFQIQQAIIDVLIKKTLKAAKDYNAKTIMLGGGVSANKELKKQFRNKIPKDIDYIFPETILSTDNALMTAITGYYHRKEKLASSKKLSAEANLRIGENMIR
jgi:N6-L-threonylcarbamoyladenine synthase